MCLLLALNRLTPSVGVFIVEIEKVNPCWDDNDNNNDDSSDNEDIDGTDFTMNLI